MPNLDFFNEEFVRSLIKTTYPQTKTMAIIANSFAKNAQPKKPNTLYVGYVSNQLGKVFSFGGVSFESAAENKGWMIFDSFTGDVKIIQFTGFQVTISIPNDPVDVLARPQNYLMEQRQVFLDVANSQLVISTLYRGTHLLFGVDQVNIDPVYGGNINYRYTYAALPLQVQWYNGVDVISQVTYNTSTANTKPAIDKDANTINIRPQGAWFEADVVIQTPGGEVKGKMSRLEGGLSVGNIFFVPGWTSCTIHVRNYTSRIPNNVIWLDYVYTFDPATVITFPAQQPDFGDFDLTSDEYQALQKLKDLPVLDNEEEEELKTKLDDKPGMVDTPKNDEN